MIDWARVAELREELGEDDIGEVIEIFLEEVENTISELNPNPTGAELEQYCHALKGSTLNLGFQEFADVCKTGEVNTSTGQPAGTIVVDIQTCYSKSKASFLKQYDGPLNIGTPN